MIQIENVGRRGFLKGMLGAGAFVLSVRWMPEEMFGSESKAGASDGMTSAPLRPNVYLAVDTDGTAYVIAHRSEMGSSRRGEIGSAEKGRRKAESAQRVALHRKRRA